MLRRAVTLNVAGQVAVLVIGLGSTVALARWLGPKDRGLLALLSYTNDLMVAVVTLGFSYAVAYFVSKKDAPRGAILGNSYLLAGALAVVFVPVFGFFGPQIAHVLSRGSGGTVWRFVGIVAVITFLDWCIHNQLFGKLQFGRLNLLIAGSRVVSLAAIVLFIGIAGWGVIGGLLAIISAASVMIIGSLLALRDVRPTVDLGLMRQMLGYGSRVSVGWVFGLVNYRADVFVLQAFVALRIVGQYVVAALVAELALVFSGAVQTSVTTLVARYEGESAQAETIASSVRHGVILTTASAVVLAIVGKLIITVAFGGAFRPAVTPMYILLPGVVFVGVAAVVTGNLRGIGRPGMSSTLAGITVVLTLALDFVLIPLYGMNGAAVASTIAYTAYGTMGLVVLARLTNVSVLELAVPRVDDLKAYGRGLSAARSALARLMRTRRG